METMHQKDIDKRDRDMGKQLMEYKRQKEGSIEKMKEGFDERLRKKDKQIRKITQAQ